MSSPLLFVLIGADDVVAKKISKAVPAAKLESRIFDESLLEGPLEPLPTVIVCLMPESSGQAAEMAQTLRMNHPDTPIYLIAMRREGFDRVDLKKNGFTDAFLFPTDEDVFFEDLLRISALASEGKVQAFRSIQLIDIQPDAVLGFDLYLHLPANNKKIRFVSAEDSLGAERTERLKKHNMSSAMVPENQVQEFYKFTAAQLKNLGKGAMSATEQKERRERAIRDLFSGIFSDSGKADTIGQGRELMSNAQGIVKAYIVAGDEKSSWYAKLMDVASQPNTPFGHAANTATIAALLAIGLGVGDPKDLALAGLLHDIGLAEIPDEIAKKSIGEMTADELAIYAKHPEQSIALIKDRKIIVSERVMKMIEQHHERFDGMGFPAKLAGPRIIPEAQILALSDMIDEMTAISSGKARVTMGEAVEKICEQGLSNPSNAPIDPTMLRNLKALFSQKKSA